MVFRIQARLKFANVAARSAGRTTIANAISGRSTTVVRDNDFAFGGSLNLVWEAEEQDTGDAGIIYALIQAMSSPLSGSYVRHHTCLDNEGPGAVCLKTAEKVWP
jgi:hypothetical protein